MTTFSAPDSSELMWRKSSHSASGPNGANCVEITMLHKHVTTVAMRDSTTSDESMLTTDVREWNSLLTSIRRGELG